MSEEVGVYVMARHAHAGDKTLWTGNDRERPLSPVGMDQARNLVTTLSGIALRTLWSSPTARCRQTLAPLAAERALPVHDLPLLAPDAPVTALDDFVSGTDLDGVLLCTHGEVFDALTERARAHGLAEAPPPGSTAKGGAWLIDPGAPVPRRWYYLPPVPLVDGDLMDTEPVLIRNLAPADDEPIRRLVERSGAAGMFPRPRAVPDDSVRVDRTRSDRQHGTAVGIGAFAGGTLLGFGCYSVTEAASGSRPGSRADCSVVVYPEAQNQGVGTALFRRLTETARDRGTAVAAAHVPAANTVVLESLASLGWTRIGEDGDPVEMHLPLTSGPARVSGETGADRR